MTLSNEETVDLIKQKIISIIRHSVEDRARQHSHNTECQLTEPNRSYKLGQVLGSWMSLIMVSGEFLRITLKLHFNLAEIKRLAYRAYGKNAPEELSDKQAIDFIKELCNLSAGQLVTVFEKNNLPTGMSLPLCTRGFYDIFADYTPAVQPFVRFGDLWSLKCESCMINMTSVIEILDVDAISGILAYEIPSTAASDEGKDEEIDFL